MSLMTEYEYCYSVAMPAKRWLDCSGKGILFTSTHTEYHVVPCSHRISFVALLWRLSNGFVPFCCGTHTCTQCWRWGRTVQTRAGQALPSVAVGAGPGISQGTVAPLAARAHCYWLFLRSFTSFKVSGICSWSKILFTLRKSFFFSFNVHMLWIF